MTFAAPRPTKLVAASLLRLVSAPAKGMILLVREVLGEGGL